MVEFERFRDQGYEGAIVRNARGLYENKRSYGLQKIKEFLDGEFKITDVVEGRGKLTGHAIFVCATAEGKSFNAKMAGDLTALKLIFESRKKYIGRSLTVKYQGLSSDGIPRFPVGLRVREDI